MRILETFSLLNLSSYNQFLSDQIQYDLELSLSWLNSGLETPTPLDEKDPSTVIIGTILIGLIIIIIYGVVLRPKPKLIQVEKQSDEQSPIIVNLVAFLHRCTDGLYRTGVIDYGDRTGKVLTELFRGKNLEGLGRDAVYPGNAFLTWLGNESVTVHRCYYTNITFTEHEANAMRENTESLIMQNPGTEAGYLEFPIHNNVTHYDNREVFVLTASRPVLLAFNFDGVPANFNFPLYGGRFIPNLIESRSLIQTCHSGFLRPDRMDDQYVL